MKKKLKRILKLSFYLAIFGLFFIVVSNRLVERKTKNSLFDNTETIPKNKVGLLLGTSKYLRDGRINLYYKYRLEAAVRLFNAGKIEFVLISGDNGTKEYDEPTTIKNDLIANGIPSEKIYLDYAGFRTLDSVVRSKTIFGQDSITIISQPFHNERAIYIAKIKGIQAIGYNAKDVTVYYGLKTKAREKLARAKMVVDIVFGKKPKFLGERIEIK
ncbi:vancomycin high temperature exclusion protein [Bacteroidota bacterium]